MGASNPAAAEALAEVLANDLATGDVDDWEQYMLKGMEMVDGGEQQQQRLGFLPTGDDTSYLRKKREILHDDDDEDFSEICLLLGCASIEKKDFLELFQLIENFDVRYEV